MAPRVDRPRTGCIRQLRPEYQGRRQRLSTPFPAAAGPASQWRWAHGGYDIDLGRRDRLPQARSAEGLAPVHGEPRTEDAADQHAHDPPAGPRAEGRPTD